MAWRAAVCCWNMAIMAEELSVAAPDSATSFFHRQHMAHYLRGIPHPIMRTNMPRKSPWKYQIMAGAMTAFADAIVNEIG
ncbi:hypothetical protein BC830DRAFT_1109959 [Chytriomyces sp. MP71]|nr:hypothetical protein BC830DRAFT_1109959 [Chytriomyces sp. MP71]